MEQDLVVEIMRTCKDSEVSVDTIIADEDTTTVANDDIICARCGENYIGQTADTLRHRMTVHRQQIIESQSTNVLSLANIIETVQ